MRDSKNILGFFIGIATGSIIGAITAIMLAPDSGRNTRTALRGRANECKDKLSLMAGEYRERFANITAEYRQKLNELSTEMRERNANSNKVEELFTEEEANADIFAEQEKDDDKNEDMMSTASEEPKNA